MILNIASALLLAILLLRFVLPLRCAGLAGRIALALLVLAACAKYQIYSWSSGTLFLPDLPVPVVVAFEFLYVFAVLLALMVVIRDLVLLALRILRLFKIRLRLPFSPDAQRLALAAACALLSLYGVHEAVRLPSVVEVEARYDALPDSLDGYRIVQMSDLHAGPLHKRQWVSDVVALANSQSPDLVAITGDFIDGSVAKSGDSMIPLSDLKARDGVYGVTGNHEYYYGMREWTRHLEAQGVDMLFNEHRDISRGGAVLEVGGIPDPAAARLGGDLPDPARVFKGGAEGAFKIMLSHEPAFFVADGNSADLQLSGHTHGGMMPILRQVVARANSGFVRGLYTIGSRHLYVSDGTGIWNGFSCRILTPPEITVITLKKSI
ncbi:MAG: metallophosphoesterase [Succinivibrio sp.]